MAIITRCRIPPDRLWGYSWTLRSAAGTRTFFNISTARSHASFLLTFMCSWTASAIWSPTVYTGLSEVMGSWKIIAMSLPRT